MKRTFLFMLLALVAACSNPTAPAQPDVFPYKNCTMVQAGEDRSPQGALLDVWQLWHCADGRNWKVDGGGHVIRWGTIFTATGVQY